MIDLIQGLLACLHGGWGHRPVQITSRNQILETERSIFSSATKLMGGNFILSLRNSRVYYKKGREGDWLPSPVRNDSEPNGGALEESPFLIETTRNVWCSYLFHLDSIETEKEAGKVKHSRAQLDGRVAWTSLVPQSFIVEVMDKEAAAQYAADTAFWAQVLSPFLQLRATLSL